MNKAKFFLIPVLVLLVQNSFTSEAEKAVEKRISQVGKVCVEGQECASTSTSISPSTSLVRTGEEVYDSACKTCHAIGLAGAPKFGDRISWGERANEDLGHLVETVTNGLGGMPPMGMCMDCSQEELSAAVKYILDALD